MLLTISEDDDGKDDIDDGDGGDDSAIIM